MSNLYHSCNIKERISDHLSTKPCLLCRYSEHEEAITAVTQQIIKMKRTEKTRDSVYWTSWLRLIIKEAENNICNV